MYECVCVSYLCNVFVCLCVSQLHGVTWWTRVDKVVDTDIMQDKEQPLTSKPSSSKGNVRTVFFFANLPVKTLLRMSHVDLLEITITPVFFYQCAVSGIVFFASILSVVLFSLSVALFSLHT